MKKPPNINPTGTYYNRVRMYTNKSGGVIVTDGHAHTKEFKSVLKTMGEYIRADYKVTAIEDPPGYMNIRCDLPND